MSLVIGEHGESVACRFLSSSGYRLLARNFRSKFGELDIVAIDGDVLVFIEVKTRSSYLFGTPEESVGYKKIQRIKKTAQIFVSQHRGLPKKMRIDLVAIDTPSSGNDFSVRLIKNISG